VGLDLANGLAVDKSLLTAVVAWELARDAGLTDEEQLAASLAALVRHLGCTAFASVEAGVAGDDVALRGRLHRSDSSRRGDVLRAVVGARKSGLPTRGGVLGLVTNLASLKQSLTSEACGAARLLSQELALGPLVHRALDEVFESYDGTGSPRGHGGDALSVVGRVATVAHVASVFALEGGAARAKEVLAVRSGRALDPTLVRRASSLVGALDPSCADYLAARQPALRAFVATRRLSTTVEAIARAFGDFADLQAPASRGHSRRVAGLVQQASATLGFTPVEVSVAVQAAHLHDLGQVAVPTSVWTMARAFRPTELERARTHVYFTERIVMAAPPLADVARVASAHHERLDGSGYHRQSPASALGRPARLLAVCDVVSALLEARAHRPARSLAAAAIEVRAAAKAGQLDADCVEAALAAAGVRAAKVNDAGALSPRELEVLRLVATGRTNKEIASALGISARTVQHHTIHVYEKLGVDTRAGAAVVASRRGLLA
jgi:response regulator RpfG family c-di-GMP phosphodiesterase